MSDAWLAPPTDEDRAERYAEAADELETAMSSLSNAMSALEPLADEGENARIERYTDITELLGDHWTELRERERDLSDADDRDGESASIDVPNGADADRLLAQAERERLPEDYEPTPMPDLSIAGYQATIGGPDGRSATLRFAKTDARTVPNRDGTTATQWMARVPEVRSARQATYEFVDCYGESAEITVAVGSVVAVGSKRHARCKTHELFAVTDDGLQSLGREDDGRRAAKVFLDTEKVPQ